MENKFAFKLSSFLYELSQLIFGYLQESIILLEPNIKFRSYFWFCTKLRFL